MVTSPCPGSIGIPPPPVPKPVPPKNLLPGGSEETTSDTAITFRSLRPASRAQSWALAEAELNLGSDPAPGGLDLVVPNYLRYGHVCQ